uniref:Uncharacterized protein n=1 Tax=Glossina brevipalpis TaxID=37001 RepID=A0A1A9W926_9MUSC
MYLKIFQTIFIQKSHVFIYINTQFESIKAIKFKIVISCNRFRVEEQRYIENFEMYLKYLFVVFAIIMPFSLGYNTASSNMPQPYVTAGVNDEVEKFVHAATCNQHPTFASFSDPANVPSSVSTDLSQPTAQYQSLNYSPTYENANKNINYNPKSITEHFLASNLRQANAQYVTPNVLTQTEFESVFLPKSGNKHQLIVNRPLQPIIVTQPGSQPAQITSGQPAVVNTSPVVYKLKPSVIYQHEIVNKIPTPLSLNPVYVKVYKPGKQINTPLMPADISNYQSTSQRTYATSYDRTIDPPASNDYADKFMPSNMLNPPSSGY